MAKTSFFERVFLSTFLCLFWPVASEFTELWCRSSEFHLLPEIFCAYTAQIFVPVCQESKYLAIGYSRLKSALLTFWCCSIFLLGNIWSLVSDWNRSSKVLILYYWLSAWFYNWVSILWKLEQFKQERLVNEVSLLYLCFPSFQFHSLSSFQFLFIIFPILLPFIFSFSCSFCPQIPSFHYTTLHFLTSH